MTMSKTFTLCIVAVLVCSVCFATTNANTIGNPVMGHDQPFHYRESRWMPPPSNPYNRGCEKENRCRSGRKLQ
ncbi:hypothetical protein C1H46_001877 [Malus baccata]|uniref:Uncharacterized protein n=1 Tax=Malus baccata TaxID=106549 RepID=A0A540NN71_MALBA|nr:hypothetical protein C1H46_001877 [Malus baccata]